MKKGQKIIGSKVRLLELATQLRDVSWGWKEKGYGRDSFYGLSTGKIGDEDFCGDAVIYIG